MRLLHLLRAMGSRIFVSAVSLIILAGGCSLVPGADPVESEVVQEGLEHPWDIGFSNDGLMVVTERAGRVRVFAGPEPGADLLHTAEVPDVRVELESGLMGLAVHDDTVFVCASRDPDGNRGEPWVVDLLRATLSDDGTLSSFEPLPLAPTIGAGRHQGCAVQVHGGELWFAIGDANLPAGENPAQDPDILNGAVVRLRLSGMVPEDAAFDSGAHSIGHRNPQGLAFHPDGHVFEVEHGTDENDEVNLVDAGGNYGYPCVTGEDDPGPIPSPCAEATEYDPPVWASGEPTLATSGATVLVGPRWGDWEGDLVVTTLKEEDLRRFSVGQDGSVTMQQTLLDGAHGRLRAAVIGPDGALYLSTSNGDDRIVRVTPAG